MIYAIGSFLIAALGGLMMATQVFRDKTPSPLIAVIHGVLGATGLGLLLWLVLTSEVSNVALAGLGILLVAALGGFFLASFHLRGKPHPKAIVAIHAGVAVVGVVTLIFAIL